MSISVEVSTRGLDFEEVASKLSGPLRCEFLERLADIAFEKAFWGAPQGKSGRLAASVFKEINADSAVVGAAAPYAVYVEYGTAPHEIKPINAGVLAFEVPGAGLVFSRIVRHPGTRPNPFLQRAADEAFSSVDGVFAELWLELIGS